MNNWQNTGKQKGLFRDSRLNQGKETPQLPTEEERSCHLCLEDCREEEIELHYLECPSEDILNARIKLIKNVCSRLQKLNTYEGITSIVGYILRKISTREAIQIGLEEIGSEDGTLWDALEG